MKNNDFKAPLIQSAAVLGGVIILFGIISSSGSESGGGGFMSVLGGIGHMIMFIIGMAISLALCISILIALFLAAVAMVSPEQASEMYADLKKNFVRQAA